MWSVGARGFHRGERLPGRPDVVFPAVRLAVFVHGCYWHRCPECRLPEPKANAEFWRSKFDANGVRDRAATDALSAAGWRVETVWEHELREDLLAAARQLADRVAVLRVA